MGNLDYTSVSRERKRLREKIAKDNALGEAFEEIDSAFLP
jgi:hypothetical protein